MPTGAPKVEEILVEDVPVEGLASGEPPAVFTFLAVVERCLEDAAVGCSGSWLEEGAESPPLASGSPP